jgi:hypothetical protein
MSEDNYTSVRFVALERLNDVALAMSAKLLYAKGPARREGYLELARVIRTMRWLVSLKGDTPEVNTDDLEGLLPGELERAVREETDSFHSAVLERYGPKEPCEP